MASLNSTRPYRFIGGPLHNQILAVPDHVFHHNVAKFHRLPSRFCVSDITPTSGMNITQITYTKRSIAGFEFFMLSTMNERMYLAAFLGTTPSAKAEKRRRRKTNEQKRQEAVRRQKGYGPWQANP